MHPVRPTNRYVPWVNPTGPWTRVKLHR